MILALGSAPTQALANAAGLPGYSGKTGTTCSPCHTGGTTQVELTGPDTLAPNQVAEYTLKVTAAGGTTGMGVAASDGIRLEPGTNARPLGGEITHAGPIAPTGGVATYTFQFFAPAAPGSAKIWAAGLVANVDGQPGGDKTGSTSLDVTIEAPEGPPEPEEDAGAPAADGGAPPRPTTMRDAGAGAPGLDGMPRPDGGAHLAQGQGPSGSIGTVGCTDVTLGRTSLPTAWLLSLVALLMSRRASRRAWGTGRSRTS